MRKCRNCGGPGRERYCSPRCRLANQGKAIRETAADSAKTWRQVMKECEAIESSKTASGELMTR
jgi:hypothetical protein